MEALIERVAGLDVHQGSMCTRARWSPASSDEAGALSSVISIGDVVKHRLGELGEEAGAMREYISGSR